MEPPIIVDNSIMLRHEIAGLLSTIDWKPSKFHTEVMLPYAEKIIEMVEEFQARPVIYGVKS